MTRTLPTKNALDAMRRPIVVLRWGDSEEAKTAAKGLESALRARFQPADVEIQGSSIEAQSLELARVPDLVVVAEEDVHDGTLEWLVAAQREGARVLDASERAVRRLAAPAERARRGRRSASSPQRVALRAWWWIRAQVRGRLPGCALPDSPDGRGWTPLLYRIPEINAQARLAAWEARITGGKVPGLDVPDEQYEAWESLPASLQPLYWRHLLVDQRASALKVSRSQLLVATLIIGLVVFAIVTLRASGAFTEGGGPELAARWIGIVLVAGAFVLHIWKGKVFDLHRAFVDVRGLAEILRLEVVKRMVSDDRAVRGESDPPVGPEPPDSPMRLMGSDRWLLKLADSQDFAADEGWHPAEGAEPMDPGAWTYRFWISDQADYFESAVRREESTLHRLSMTGAVIALLALVALSAWMVPADTFFQSTTWLVVTSFAFFIAANLGVYANVVVPSEQVQRYRMFARIFAAERERYSESRAGIQERARELVRSALLEQALWLAGQRARRVDPVRPL